MPAKYRLPVKRGPKSDPQQYRLYRMESENLGARHYVRLSRKAIRRMCRVVCRAFQVPHVKIRFKELNGWTAQWDHPNLLTFGSKVGSRDTITVVHELAHHVHSTYIGDAKQQDHGPQFMCIYMALLDTMRVIPAISMKPLCARYRIAYIDPGVNASVATLRKRVLAGVR